MVCFEWCKCLHFVELVDRVAKLLLEVADTVRGVGQDGSMA